MVDCGNPRCLQEKRHLKKELLSWGRKIPYAIGLELVAESLAGSGKIKTLLLPFNDLELKNASDWQPASPSPTTSLTVTCVEGAVLSPRSACSFCEGLPAICSTVSSLSSATIPPTLLCNALSPGHSDAAPETPGSAVTDFESAMASVCVQQSGAAAAVATAQVHALDDDLDSPLDLSSSGSKKATAATLAQDHSMTMEHRPESRAVAELRVPEVHRVKKKKEGGGGGAVMCPATAAIGNGIGKRAYTDMELRAAVEAIQSGAVGTRRAAQMYGVPRSTLRNKVFKAAELVGHVSPPQHSADTAASARAYAAAASSSNPAASAEATARAAEEAASGVAAGDEDTWIKKLQHLRHKHNLNAARSLDVFNVPFGYFGFNPFFMSPYSLDYSYAAAANGLLMPYMPDFVKNVTQKRLELERTRCLQPQQQLLTITPSSRAQQEAEADDDLRVPRYQPANTEGTAAVDGGRRYGDSDCSTDDYGDSQSGCTSSSATADTQRDVEATQVELTPPHRGNILLAMSPWPLNHASSNGVGSGSNGLAQEEPASKKSRSAHEDGSDIATALSLSSAITPMPHQSQGASNKNKRPKRGQYRKYDSELLAQAVRAVQRGEMSVHRAGTYFGVPHSTLEYKVKERHLLRKKKLAAESAARAAKKGDNTAAATHGPASDNEEHHGRVEWLAKHGLLAPQPSRPTYTDDEVPADNDDNSPPQSCSGLALSTPASELLKKLQARAHGKSSAVASRVSSARSQESSSVDVQ